MGDSITMNDRFSGGGGESASSLRPPLVVAVPPPDVGDGASDMSALDAVRLMPLPLQAIVVADDCIYPACFSFLFCNPLTMLLFCFSSQAVGFNLISSLLCCQCQKILFFLFSNLFVSVFWLTIFKFLIFFQLPCITDCSLVTSTDTLLSPLRIFFFFLKLSIDLKQDVRKHLN